MFHHQETRKKGKMLEFLITSQVENESHHRCLMPSQTDVDDFLEKDKQLS